MLKRTETWAVADLEERHATIEFPEYQREPSVWSRAAKQRLIDSMLRQFDIASLYIYDNDDGSLDCIDGRQRIGAIMAFLGNNPNDDDNWFPLKPQNEIYDEDSVPFGALSGMSYREISEHATEQKAHGELAEQLIQAFRNYSLTIVKLSNSQRPEEFNLQFTRLNLGTVINSGEKLHAMFGEMRDVCFGETGLGRHSFLNGVGIPTRRFSKEQVAAQILAQTFALKETKEFTRTRHFDLQRLFKECARLSADQNQWIEEVKRTLDVLSKAFTDPAVLRNRAMAVSTVLLAGKLGIVSETDAEVYAHFIEEFLCRLKWQIHKGLDVDKEYRYLTEFQRHVTQASVEKPAVKARDRVLHEGYDFWKATSQIKGDMEYLKATKKEPSRECRTPSSL